MTQGAAKKDDSGEIDRIIQEIQEIESSIDQVEPAKAKEPAKVISIKEAAPEAAAPAATAAEEAVTEEDSVEQETPVMTNQNDPFENALKAAQARTGGALEEDTSSKTATASSGDGDLSMSIGGCSTVQLQFARGDIQVTLKCDDDCLTISTDGGAEFRVPFRKAA